MCGTIGACSSSTVPGHSPQPVAVDAVLDAVGEQDLHADTNAEHGTAGNEPAIDDAFAAHRSQPGHAGFEGADTGHDKARRVFGDGGIGGEDDVSASTLHRANDRAEVAGAVIQDRNAGVERPQGLPWWTGCPVSRGSSAHGVRRARATALNCASAMWCGSRPPSSWTCNVMPAWCAIDSKTCAVSEPLYWPPMIAVACVAGSPPPTK